MTTDHETAGSRPVRWGILGTANIARKNWKAIRLTGNATVTAVASRDSERSRRFIAECQADAPMAAVPQALGSYEALLGREDVDAVYIPLPTGLRKQWVLRAAAAGKHIVCEKPCAVNAADLEEMLAACRRQGVQFLDGVMFMHSQRLDTLRAVLEDGVSVGPVRRIACAFTFGQDAGFFGDNIRVHSALEPWGCLGDLGWYCIRFALWERQWQWPREVCGHLLAEAGRPDSPARVPTSFSGELFFGGGVSCGFYCSFVTSTEQWVVISGERGSVRMEDFVLPFAGMDLGLEAHHAEFQVRACDFRMEPHFRRFSVVEASHGQATAQETNLFRNFSAQVLSGQLNPVWPQAALQTQQVMAACLDSARAAGRHVAVTARTASA